MHYVIIGAGAIGATLAGRLHQHGHRVTLVGRGDHLAAMRERGLSLAAPEGEYRLALPVAARPDELVLDPDCVLVCAVKSHDTLGVLEMWADAPVRGGGVAGSRLPMVCAQNGVANERAALRRFERVYGLCVWLTATYLTPGAVRVDDRLDAGVLLLGRYPHGLDRTGWRIAADLSGSGFSARADAEVMRSKYGKLLVNLDNGPDALFGARIRDLSGRLRAEGVAVLAAAGINFRIDEVEPVSVGPADTTPAGAGPADGPAPAPAGGGSSTWQSLARGTGATEVDYLNGEIVLLGREHAVATPVNRAVQLAVRRAALTGMPAGRFPADEFRALVEH